MKEDRANVVDFLLKVKGFGVSKVIMTTFDLDLFPLLDKEPLSIGELVARRRLNPVLAQSFMRVLQTSGFVTLQGGKYNLTDLARSVLPIYANIKSWIEEMKQFFHRVDDLTQSLLDLDYQKKIYSQNFYSSRVLSDVSAEAKVELFAKSMDGSQPEISEKILNHFDFSRYNHMIDMGGGYGRFAMNVAKKYRNIHTTILDLPEVCEEARRKIADEGLSDRVCFRAGSFFDPIFNCEADLVSFVRILTDWGEEQIELLLKNAYQALTPNGMVLIVEPIHEESSEMGESSAISGLMMALLGGGRRTVNDFMRFLSKAGFTELSCTDLEWALYRLISARKA